MNEAKVFRLLEKCEAIERRIALHLREAAAVQQGIESAIAKFRTLASETSAAIAKQVEG